MRFIYHLCMWCATYGQFILIDFDRHDWLLVHVPIALCIAKNFDKIPCAHSHQRTIIVAIHTMIHPFIYQCICVELEIWNLHRPFTPRNATVCPKNYLNPKKNDRKTIFKFISIQAVTFFKSNESNQMFHIKVMQSTKIMNDL